MNRFYVTWSKQVDVTAMDVASAEGDEVVLQDGRRIYDFVCSSFQVGFGHSHPLIRRRLTDQLDSLCVSLPKSAFALKDRVSEKLQQRLGLGPGKLLYTVSGAESVENALKIARQVSGKKIVLARRRSYHGASLGAMSVSGDWRRDAHVCFEEGTLRIPEPHEDPQCQQTQEIIRQAGPGTIAAIILEPISGTNGVIIPTRDWWQRIEKLCREHQILLIADEVLTGFGRTGADFAFQHYSAAPDIVCLSKAMTGGYVPFGAVWTSKEIASYFDSNILSCGLTNYAHPLGLAATDAVLEILADEQFARRRRELQQAFAQALDQLGRVAVVGEVRYRGLLAAVETRQPAPDWTVFLQHGLFLFSRGNLVVLAPPMISEPRRLSGAMQQLAKVLEESDG